ncbi:unnamed protein product [Clonostachys rhizophaga]|uniref:BZIP domain-containing protein n=1 Tax=Clonostachys rhizophaga TaxID=160324 RepID=A0A9N9VQI1_9HYPO|nr:unnamed protein product [Clonostachys rhizophaga]
MVTSFVANMQPLYRSALSVDTHHAHKFFEDDDNNVLDDNILDQSAVDSTLELSPQMLDSRRESFAIGGPSLFSPKTDDWHSVDMQSVPSNNPFFDHTSNNFMRPEQNHTLAPQANGWNPFPQVDGIQPEYEASAAMFRAMPGQTPFTHPGNMFASLASQAQSIPPSPQKDFIGNAQMGGKKTRPSSPAIRSHNDLRRGDGIRKKNARFEIPAERNLSNIDQLIAQSTDEAEVKELKQQKRLLRNRQAALDSRQRKKQHTERLEDEKKQYTAVITEMEEEMNELKAKMDQLLREKQSYVDYVETLTLERDEMIRSHTNETGELRKKIAVLTDHVQNNMGSSAPNAANGFTGGYGDMEDLTMNAPWEQNTFVNNFPMEPEVKQEMSIVPAKKTEATFAGEGEKSTGQNGGLLFMLFLVGAFVLSSRSTPSIPRVSEDVRAASATLLNNVLKDAGVGSQTTTMQALAPQPSGSWSDPSTGVALNDIMPDSVAPSMLGELGDSLTQPTQEQTNEQIFSLSAQQYNGVMDQDFIHNGAPERFNSQGRRNLAQELASMRTAIKQDGAAEVYTRSLLWDQIPRDVVRNFASMVAESNNAQNEQRNEAMT